MMFASDNTGPVHPKIMDAVMGANDGYAMPYGNDTITAAARDAVRALFEAPEAAVEFVATGSVANALALACMAKPWDGVFCHRTAHVEEDECGAPDFYSGAKTILIDGADGKITPEGLEAAIMQCKGRGVHGAQPGPLTLTNITERGTAYSLAEIRALTAVARAHGLATHLDGARFANACAALGCSPAEMTWKAGIDAVSFGGTKNGCMGVEAVVIFDPAHGRELALRRKRGGICFPSIATCRHRWWPIALMVCGLTWPWPPMRAWRSWCRVWRGCRAHIYATRLRAIWPLSMRRARPMRGPLPPGRNIISLTARWTMGHLTGPCAAESCAIGPRRPRMLSNCWRLGRAKVCRPLSPKAP